MRTHSISLGQVILGASSLLLAPSLTAAAAAASGGDLSVLTINVAGLPAILQGNDVPGDKATNARTIGTLLGRYAYDVVHMQEDFNYHAYIYETDTHPHRTPTSGGVPFGSGLNTVANHPWVNFERVKWDECSNASGADCLTPKGFTFMRLALTSSESGDEAVYVDFYNLHADAGTESADLTARTSNLRQVVAAIEARSKGNAVVVFGDTNSRYSRTGDVGLRELLAADGMADPWVDLERGGVPPTEESVCAELPSTTSSCEIVDKVFYRSSPLVNLEATSLQYVGTSFLQPDGNILTDHNPVLVNLTWSTTTSPLRQSAYFGGEEGEDWFSDAPALASTSTPPSPTILRFRGADRLDGVGLTLSDGTTFAHGGTGGSEVTLELAAGEHWSGAELCRGQKSGKTRNFWIRAATSTGRAVEAGTKTDDCAAYTAPEGWHIVGFAGRSGDEVDQLAFLYAPI